MTPRGLAAAAIAAVLAGPAAAQELPADAGSGVGRRPLLEVGGQLAAIGVYPGAAVLVLGGPRLTLNLTANDALETLAEAAGPLEDSGLHGLYGVQYKRTFGPRVPGRRTWFATAGMLGAFRHLRMREWKEQRPDGSTLVWPGHTSFKVWKPVIATVGLGVERQVGRHLAVRADVQAFAGAGGVGMRAGAGVSIPLGGADASRP